MDVVVLGVVVAMQLYFVRELLAAFTCSLGIGVIAFLITAVTCCTRAGHWRWSGSPEARIRWWSRKERHEFDRATGAARRVGHVQRRRRAGEARGSSCRFGDCSLI